MVATSFVSCSEVINEHACISAGKQADRKAGLRRLLGATGTRQSDHIYLAYELGTVNAYLPKWGLLIVRIAAKLGIYVGAC